MEKPTLQMAPHQVAPPLPDPYEFADRISASLRFIGENPAAVVSDLSLEMLDLWSLNPQELEIVRTCLERVVEMIAVAGAADAGNAIQASVITEVAREAGTAGADLGPRILSSLIIFAHIYLTYYHLEDFADLENFTITYFKFQTLLQPASHTAGHQIPLFDFENLDRTLDEIQQVPSIERT